MARTLVYTFKNETKSIPFSYQQHRTIQEAAAAAEGLDIKDFLEMEQQIEMVTRDAKAVRNYRDNYFRELGFSKITLAPKD
ncbi:DUF2960 domain-containing protein [Thaumasiovibrio subtropicus]|uniref:DUF2960 domain-containing protein n=1 Tax=Thaumasiovibrio subtropicus TaxID=1891207 RepID=UPI000B362980|nr:DUF2960 domain-containing protein [Thaumasiovibrio subtropicus]